MNITEFKIQKDFGKKCKYFSPLCPVCVAWHAYETLADLYHTKKAFSHIKAFKR